VVTKESLRGAKPHDKKINSYHNYLPLPLNKGKGIKGIGFKISRGTGADTPLIPAQNQDALEQSSC